MDGGGLWGITPRTCADVGPSGERCRLARLVEPDAQARPVLSHRTTACHGCDVERALHLVLASLMMLEQRVRDLEHRRPSQRGRGQPREAICEVCGRSFIRASVLRKKCDPCRAAYKSEWNKARWARRQQRGDHAKRRTS